jgi:hypothetical protein
MMPTIGVVLVRHQKETRSVASRTAFYRLLPPKRQGIAVSVQQRRSAPISPIVWQIPVSQMTVEIHAAMQDFNDVDAGTC